MDVYVYTRVPVMITTVLLLPHTLIPARPGGVARESWGLEPVRVLGGGDGPDG